MVIGVWNDAEVGPEVYGAFLLKVLLEHREDHLGNGCLVP